MNNLVNGNGQKKGDTRVAIIGLGAGAERIMLPGLASLSQVQLVAGCDLDLVNQQRAKGRWHIPHVYADAAEMLTKEQPEFVAIATPPFTHRELCLLALEHGCHIYCEKPFMPSLHELDEVITVAQQKRRCIGVNSQYYQMPIFRCVQDALDHGSYGRLYQIEAWQHMYLLPHEEGGWKAALQPRRVLFEFGTHTIDLLCRFLKDIPQAVTARMAKVRSDVDGDVCLNVRLDFPNNRFVNIAFNRMSYAPMRYFEMRLNCEGAAIRTSLGGVARFDLGWNREKRRPRWRFSLTTGGEARLERNGDSKLLARQSGAAFGTATGAHFLHFSRAVQQGDMAASSMDYMRDVLRIIMACYTSAEQDGQLVKI